MADTANTKIVREQGGDTLVVKAGGKIVIEDGGSIGGADGPADAIADLDLGTTYSTDAPAVEAAVNGILAALRDAGIVKSA